MEAISFVIPILRTRKLGPEETKVLLKILADSEDQQHWCLVPPVQVTSAAALGSHSRELFWLVAPVLDALVRATEEGAKVSPLYVEVQIRLSHDLDVNVPAQRDLQAGSE